MSLKIHFQGGSQAGQVLAFGDDVELITIGRDAAKCQVVFPADQTKVGREHCSLRRALGRYRLVLNKDDLVFVNGQRVVDGHELPANADLQLGAGGPTLVVESSLAENLLPTQMHGRQRGQTTMLRDTEKAARRGWMLAAAAVVLGVIIYFVFHGENADIKKEQKEQLVKQDVLTKEQESQKALQAQQQKLLETQSQQVAQLAQTDEKRLSAALNNAIASTYLVLNQDPNANESPEATAWVVDHDKGILATNGHVADIFNQIAKDQPTHKLVVRSADNPPRTFVIKSVLIHPGFFASTALWQKFHPARRTGETSGEAIAQPGPFCDVALMYVDKPDGLGPSLPLADAPTVAGLRAGSPVGSVGYPMEGLSLGGVNVTRPMPVVHQAYVSAMTDYFGASQVEDSERLLMEDAVPIAGGASGSAMLNPAGQIVAVVSAGNFIGSTQSGARIGSSAQLNFAQRADLVRELLDGHVDEIQAARTKLWEQDLARYYQPAATVQQGIDETQKQQRLAKIAAMVAQCRAQLSAELEVKDVTQIADFTGTLTDAGAKAGTFTGTKSFSAKNGGSLLVAVVSNKAPSMTMELFRVVAGARKTSFTSKSYQNDWLPYCFFDIDAATDFEAIVSGTDKGAEFTMQAYLFQTGPLTADSLAAAWVNRHLTWRILGYGPQILLPLKTGKLSEINGTSPTYGAVVPVEVLAAGEYLAVAHAPGKQNLKLVVSQQGAAAPLGQDIAGAVWPNCSFTVAGPGRVDISILGPAADVDYELTVYSAGPPLATK